MSNTPASSRSERKARLRAAHKTWLDQVVALTGKSHTALARECGLDQSALTRFMNDEARGSKARNSAAMTPKPHK